MSEPGAGVAGRRAFVTGGSRGVGAAVARRLAAGGARVAVASRSGADLGLAGGLGLRCDVSRLEEVEAAAGAAAEVFGGLDLVVANAGIGSYGDFLDIPMDQVEAMIDVNLKGTLYTARATLGHLVAAGGGDFISLASVAGLRGLPGETVYNASKFGQVGFTRSLDHEMRERGVRCTSVCPGGIATDFDIENRSPEALAQMMSAEDVAEVVWFCVTRPAGVRILTTSLRPPSEPSWG